MLAVHESRTSTSAAVLEPSGVHPRGLGRAMKQVAAALSKGQSSSPLYGVVVYSKKHKGHQRNYIAATGKFCKAYLRGVQAIKTVMQTSLEKDHLRTLEAKDFGGVRFFGKATLKSVQKEMKSSPGVYIVSSHLDAGLLKHLGLPLWPERLRDTPLVMQVKDVLSSLEEGQLTKTLTALPHPVELTTGLAVEAGIRKDTLDWRKQFMSNNLCWNSAQVAEESGSGAANRAAIASRWVAEKKIFAVEFGGHKWFPRFQFQDGRPVPAISQVMGVFPEHATGWDLAHFFVTPNSNLAGRKPLELLKENPGRLVSLAQAFAHPADVF